MANDLFSLDFARIEAILSRYAVEGPRYTSYPTAPVWNEDFGVEQYKTELAGGGAEGVSVPGEDDGLSLYVHVPFCHSLCHFCACNRIITSNAELPLRFLDTLEREVAAVREASGPRTASQQHWASGPAGSHPSIRSSRRGWWRPR